MNSIRFLPKALLKMLVIITIGVFTLASSNARALNIFYVGDQFTVLSFEIHASGYYAGGNYKENGTFFYEALTGRGHDVEWMRTYKVSAEFPEQLEELQAYDVIIISDVVSEAFLFHPEVLSKSIPHPNRLKLLREYVKQGGGLLTIGGWMSYAGIGNKARYHDTPLEECLPVDVKPYDDRTECPEGITPLRNKAAHPVLEGLPGQWPFFLGYNKVTAKEGATVLLWLEDDPLLAVWEYGDGRVGAFMSDCTPHWGPQAFLEWEGYAPFWDQLVRWLAGE
jgi:uncharacterized membrane protein